GGAYPAHADEDELKTKIERQVTELSKKGVSAAVQNTLAALSRRSCLPPRTARGRWARCCVLARLEADRTVDEIADMLASCGADGADVALDVSCSGCRTATAVTARR